MHFNIVEVILYYSRYSATKLICIFLDVSSIFIVYVLQEKLKGRPGSGHSDGEDNMFRSIGVPVISALVIIIVVTVLSFVLYCCSQKKKSSEKTRLNLKQYSTSATHSNGV